MQCLIRNQIKLKMSNQLTEVRILLSNRSNHSDDLLSAASLAKTLEVRLKGFYLEEEDLIHAAELSISSHISAWSAKEKVITVDSVKKTFRTHANHQKQELKRIAEREEIEFEFDVVRGERNSWIFDDIKKNSLLFVTHQNVNKNCCNNFIYSFLNKNKAIKDPVKVVFSSSKASMRALNIATKIALHSNKPLTVLMDTDTFEDEIVLREQINNNLDTHRKINVSAELIKNQNKVKALTKDLYMLVYPLDANETTLLQKLLQGLRRPLILVK